MAFKYIITKLIKENSFATPKGAALDLGCGKGFDTLFIADEGFDVQAVDHASSSLDAIKKNNSNIEVLESKIEHFSIKKNYYSLIIASFSLQFLSKEDAKKVIQDMVDGIVSGGVVIFNVIGDRDAWADRSNWHIWDLEEIKKFVSEIPNAKLRNFNQYEGMGDTIKEGLKYWHVFEVVLIKK
ncbi:MAG: Tellurite resistance protein TehB [Candidatus Taylorbacteria bacterium]|nr:Tellurite resistance protein TehB [Candidatus Taylorbacteria bacterium]